MEGLTEGRVVHYVMPDGKHCPAIIVRNWDELAGTSNLTVFPDWNNDAGYTEADKQALRDQGIDPEEVKRGLFWKTSVVYSEDKEPNTWHWIERA